MQKLAQYPLLVPVEVGQLPVANVRLAARRKGGGDCRDAHDEPAGYVPAIVVSALECIAHVAYKDEVVLAVLSYWGDEVVDGVTLFI